MLKYCPNCDEEVEVEHGCCPICHEEFKKKELKVVLDGFDDDEEDEI